MKKHQFFIFLITLFVMIVSCNRETIVVYDISGERFLTDYAKSKKEKSDILILDTRSNNMYLMGHVKDAINIPHEELIARIDEIADLKDLKTYVYDNDIEVSYEAIKILIDHGFKNLYNCSGTDEYAYDYVSYSTIRLPKLVEMAETNDYVIIDYRMKVAYNSARIPNSILLELDNFDSALKKIPFSNKGYLIYSIDEENASVLAKKMQSLGFLKIYVCRERVMEHLKYLKYKVIGD